MDEKEDDEEMKLWAKVVILVPKKSFLSMPLT